MQKQNEMELMLDHIDCGISVYEILPNQKLKVLFVNKGFCKLVGGRKEELEEAFKKNPLYGVSEEYKELVLNFFGRIIPERSSGEVSFLGKMVNGDSRWITLKAKCSREEDGQEFLYATYFDNSKQINADREIERNLEERYELEKKRGMRRDEPLVAHLVYDVSRKRIIEWQCENLIISDKDLTSMQETARRGASLILDEDAREEYFSIHREEELRRRFEAGETEITMDTQVRLADGRVRWIRNFFHIVKDSEKDAFVLYEDSYDVNKSKSLDIMMEFAVNDEYDLLGSVNFEDECAVILYGENSYNVFSEPLVEEDYTVSLMRFAEHAVLPEERTAYLQRARIERVKQELKDKNAFEFYFHMEKNHETKTKKVRYIRYAGNPNICLFIQNDITDVLRREQEKQNRLKDALEAAKNANHSKSTFLSQMSHEIRTPMNAIIGMAQLARDCGSLKGKDEYIEKIQFSSDYLLGIINDILDMSRIESGKFELHPTWASPQGIFGSCIDMLLPAMKKKNITFLYPKLNRQDTIEYYVDILRVQQVYMNLLNNALKFTPEGGTISLQIKNRAYDDTISTDEITISDTGCGMSPEFLTRIFQPFEQEQNPYSGLVQGTGLGLALVKKIVNEMGGDISVKSELNKGSSFQFTITYRYRRTELKKNDKPPMDIQNLSGKRVLLVDDHPLNREIAEKLLEKEGMRVEAACNGQEAVDRFRGSEQGYYDVILMDIRMPVMDGLQAAKAIRALSRPDARTIPIIAMTANAFDEDVKESLDAGMNSHLAKPIEPKKLYETISYWLKIMN